jgi:hypothetical protein
MFKIPTAHQMLFVFPEAVRIITARGNGDLLAGMESMDRLWDEYCSGKLADSYTDDDDFFSDWCYETSAYNTVYENMAPLFAAKETA